MELTSQTFLHQLPWMLYELSESCFVSLDLEMSGIPMSPAGQAPKTQSLQERYAENKAAAEKYQVLQFGLTICYEDAEKGMYILKPYNINLSPMVDRALDINRDWTFMSWSMEFLQGNHFSIDALTKYGVRYLSRAEEASAIEHALRRNTLQSPEALEIKEDDQESQEFLRAVRRAINNWIAEGKNRNDFLNFPPPFRPKKSQAGVGLSMPKTLNGMQRWLVHHLVSSEYPKLTSKSKGTFVQIEEANATRDEKVKEDRLKSARERIQKHVGVRWLVEALVGGDLTDLEPQTFRPILTKVVNPTVTLAQVSDGIKGRLKGRQTVFVGHNCFTDLIFFHQCFLGQLPDKVEDFQARIHQLFPVLVDTKYLATHDCGFINPLSSLQDINRAMAKIPKPVINVDPMHSKYVYKSSNHEAGYDSMLAAVAFIRLAPMLQKGQKVQANTKGTLEQIEVGISCLRPVDVDGIFATEQSGSIRNNFLDFFDLENEGSIEGPCGPNLVLADNGSAQVAAKASRGELVPRLGSRFWQDYGNRLRLFGTLDKMLRLGAM